MSSLETLISTATEQIPVPLCHSGIPKVTNKCLKCLYFIQAGGRKKQSISFRAVSITLAHNKEEVGGGCVGQIS